jgi:hypothetical protein
VGIAGEYFGRRNTQLMILKLLWYNRVTKLIKGCE